MIKVFSSPDGVQVGLIESVLAAAHISYEVRNNAVSQLIGPSLIMPLELWVRHEDHEEAARLIASSQLEPNG
jgi:hypothetical protein